MKDTGTARMQRELDTGLHLLQRLEKARRAGVICYLSAADLELLSQTPLGPMMKAAARRAPVVRPRRSKSKKIASDEIKVVELF